MGMRGTRSTLLAAVLLAGCGASRRDVPVQPPSLYERLGGKAGLTRVVEEFVAIVGDDKRIAGFFSGADTVRLQRLLVEQLCQVTGGPCVYSGRPMAEVHGKMGLRKRHLDAFLGDLSTALDRNQIPAGDRQELLRILAAMEKDVIVPPKAGGRPRRGR